MLLQNVWMPIRQSVRVLSVRTTIATAEVSKDEDMYKTSGGKVDGSRPTEWDTAIPFEEIPGPKPMPIVGNLWRFMPVIGDLYQIPTHKMFTKFKEQYGNVVIFKGVPGGLEHVYIFDPKDIETLHRNSGKFPLRNVLKAFVHYRTVERKDIFQDVGSILISQGEEWHKIRSAANPILMQPKIIHQYISKMDAVAMEMVNNMRHFSRLDEHRQMPESFVDELYKWSFESVGVFALNKHFGCLDLNASDDSEAKTLLNAILTMLRQFYFFEVQPPIWKFIRTPLYKKFAKNLDYITSVIMKNIDNAFLEPIDDSVPEQQLSVLQKLGKKDKKIAFMMVMDMILAGIDSTGKTLGAILYFLAKNPNKQSKLRQEIFDNLPEKNSPITSETLEKSPYLKAVIKESNRIAPVIAGLVRTTINDLVLGGYQIPKGTNVITVTIHTSTSAENFKDPEKYLPERWLRETNDEYSAKNAHPFASLPFGFGPRSCVGMRLANLELEVALINILRNFELSWEQADMKFATYLLYGIDDPLKLTVKELDR